MKELSANTFNMVQNSVSAVFPIMVAVLITSVIALIFYVKKRQSGF
ncbi:MAG: hypothetical protein LCH51_11650 [Bacteroidetes bacterium]|nr:hypothetical protein [Bacteroidota bacterium]